MGKPFVPPRFVVEIAWRVHRLIARRGPGRGLWEPGQKNAWGALTLTSTGRRSGEARDAILGYLVDGERLHTLAMNGWGEGHPAWWWNLRAEPRARVTMSDGSSHAVVARAAKGEERERVRAEWIRIEPGLAPLAERRSTPTEVVVLTPV